MARNTRSLPLPVLTLYNVGEKLRLLLQSQMLMKRSDSTLVSYLYTALLIAGVLTNLCAAPNVAFSRLTAQQESSLFSNATNSSHSQALTNAPRTHPRVPASQQKRVRLPALDFAALPADPFQLATAALGQRALDRSPLSLRSFVLVRPRGRAPPVSV